MGFKPIDEESPLVARFSLLASFEVLGIDVPKEVPFIHRRIQFRDLPYSVAIGHSINTISKHLIGEDLVHDEAKWRRKHGCSAPYLLVQIGPTKNEACVEGYYKACEDGGIMTHGCFASLKDSLRQAKSRIVPTLMSSLMVEFSRMHYGVKIKPITSVTMGSTTAGTAIRERPAGPTIRGFVIRDLPLTQLSGCVTAATDQGKRIDDRAAEFFYLGTTEDDSTKSFLFYFISIEITTHQAFKRIEDSCLDQFASNLPENVRGQGAELLSRQQQELKNLRDRFIWCAICRWTNVSDENILEFAKLKTARDNIAHGNIKGVQDSETAAARELALLVLAEESRALGTAASQT